LGECVFSLCLAAGKPERDGGAVAPASADGVGCGFSEAECGPDGEVLGLMDPGQLRAMLSGINHQVGRNKGLKNHWPFRVGVLDGHEFFSLSEALLSGVLSA